MQSEPIQRIDRPSSPHLAEEEAVVMALLDAIDEPVGGEAGHIRRVRQGAQILAEQLRREETHRREIDDEFLRQLYWASPLHDVGKIAVDRSILAKPDKLTPAEIDAVRRHVLVGGQLLDRAAELAGGSPLLIMAARIARFHHERFDGSGYCAGLRGAEIPLAARIVALADVYDALTSLRAYKPAYSPDEARRMVEAESGRHFDPAVVAAFRARYADFVGISRRESGESSGPHVDRALRASLESNRLS